MYFTVKELIEMIEKYPDYDVCVDEVLSIEIHILHNEGKVNMQRGE